MKLIDLLILRKNQNAKYFHEPLKYCAVIKKNAEELFGKNTRAFLYGSVVKGNYTYSSDIDVLVMVPGLKPGLHAEETVFLKKNFEITSPFSIILCNEHQYEDWFKLYILDKFIEV